MNICLLVRVRVPVCVRDEVHKKYVKLLRLAQFPNNFQRYSNDIWYTLPSYQWLLNAVIHV